jgi:hypothetical protein
VWSLSAALFFSTATSVTPNHPPYRHFHLLHLHIGVCALHLLALHYDKPEGIRTDSIRTNIDPCTTHVPRTNTEQLLGGKQKRFSNIGLICAACACYEA